MIKPVKMGIEIEYLMMTHSCGPIYSGWRQASIDRFLGLQILRDASLSLQPGIGRRTDNIGHRNVYLFRDGKIMVPDTFTLLETVTSPSTDLDVLRTQLWDMKRSLIGAADKYQHSRVSGAACPIGYAYEDMQRSGRITANNAGMHVHLEAPNDKVKIKFCNLIMQVMPELTALSVNSPIYNRSPSQYRSKRLHTSPLVGPSGVSPLEYEPANPLQFNDPSSRYRYLTPYTKSKRTIELRGFDTPMTIDWAMGIAALMQCLGAKASRLFVNEQRNTVVGNNSKIRKANFEAAMTHGLRAKFRPDGTFGVKLDDKRHKMSFLYHGAEAARLGRTIPATLAIKRLLYYVEAEAYELGLLDYLTPLYEAVRTGRDQAEEQLSWYRTLGFDGYVNKLHATSARAPRHGRKNVGGARRYFTVRQILRGSKADCLYLTRAGMRRARTAEGQQVLVSGPLGSLRVRVARDNQSSSRIRLGDGEARLGKRLRRDLGISMYDPIIIGEQPAVPVVIERTDGTWTPSATGGLLRRARVG